MEEKIGLNPKNNNLLESLPEPKMKLYVHNGFFTTKVFDTQEELLGYRKNNDIRFSINYICEYIGNFAGRSDVLKHTYSDGKIVICTAIDDDGYAVYNSARSAKSGENVWEFEYGDLREEYAGFRERGIIFENDVYAKIDESIEFYRQWGRNIANEVMESRNIEDRSRTLQKKEDN